MTVSIRTVDDSSLSKLIKEAHIALTAKEAKLIDHCQKLSFHTWAGFHDGDLVCAWGIIPPSIISTEVYLWLHTTEAIEGRQFLFVRHSQRAIEEILKEYNAIVGHVKADAESSKRWLKWLGAHFNASQGNMLTFRIERKWQTH